MIRFKISTYYLVLFIFFLTCFTINGQVEKKMNIRFVDYFFENASPLTWSVQGDSLLKICLMADYERDAPNRQSNHWNFRIEADKGTHVKIMLTGMDNIWNGRPAPSNLSQNVACYISYDHAIWQGIPTARSKSNVNDLLVDFTMEGSSVFIARMPPYTNTDLENLKKSISGNPLVKIIPIGETVEKRPLEIIRLGNADAPNSVLIRARAHPWEPGGNWVVEGLIRKYLSDAVSKGWTENFSIYIMPMANKDGVARGMTRFNLNGKDLNRNWDQEPDSVLCPEKYAFENFLKELIKNGRKPSLIFDLHNDDYGSLSTAGHEKYDTLFLNKMRLFEKLLRKYTSFSEKVEYALKSGTQPHTNGSFQDGLLARYGIDALIYEFNANWIESLKKIPSESDYMKVGENLNFVFAEYFSHLNPAPIIKQNIIQKAGEISKSNLIFNPGFEKSEQSANLPEGWTVKVARAEIAPSFATDRSVSHTGNFSMRMSGKGSPGTFGYIVSSPVMIKPDIKPGEFRMTNENMRDTAFLGKKQYRVSCYFKTKEIESVAKNIWLRVNWLDKDQKIVFTEIISDKRKEGDWYRAEQILTAPKIAASMNIELALQWTSNGSVWWDDVDIEETAPALKRWIKLGTSCTSTAYPSTPEKNRSFYSSIIAEAGTQGVDLLCLGEGITVVSTGKAYADVAETIPGPTSQILGEAARRSKTWVVAGIYEREGSLIYNTAILIDRNGNIAGKYRKTHLPETEVYGGITPGDSYPVFQTEFGKIGIEICYDNFFPEVARSLALNGAEIIVVPIWGDPREQNSVWDLVASTRAIDNSVFLLASMYNRKSSLIFSPAGQILDNGKQLNGLVTARILLDTRTFEPWLSVYSYGDWKNLFRQERRPETYNELVKR